MRAVGVALALLGLAQMAGDLAGLAPLRGLALATTASPAPKVFSSVDGLETYSIRFFLEWTDRAGEPHELALVSDSYSEIDGPYNRRNVFGAVVAYGPVFVTDARMKPVWEAVARFSLCGDAPLLRELGIDPGELAGPPRVRLEPLPGTDMRGRPTVLEAPC